MLIRSSQDVPERRSAIVANERQPPADDQQSVRCALPHDAACLPQFRAASHTPTTGVLMRAAVWHGRRDVKIDTVPDPVLQDPTDAIIRVTSTGLCGSDLHLCEVLAPFMTAGDILGHEPVGVVEEVGS